MVAEALNSPSAISLPPLANGAATKFQLPPLPMLGTG